MKFVQWSEMKKTMRLFCLLYIAITFYFYLISFITNLNCLKFNKWSQSTFLYKFWSFENRFFKKYISYEYINILYLHTYMFSFLLFFFSLFLFFFSNFFIFPIYSSFLFLSFTMLYYYNLLYRHCSIIIDFL